MGPVTIEVKRWGPFDIENDQWGYHAMIGVEGVVFAKGHVRGRGVPLEKCQADAIRAVKKWRDSIKVKP